MEDYLKAGAALEETGCGFAAAIGSAQPEAVD